MNLINVQYVKLTINQNDIFPFSIVSLSVIKTIYHLDFSKILQVLLAFDLITRPYVIISP